VAPLIAGIIAHFRFHIRCISVHKLFYFNLLLLLLLVVVVVLVLVVVAVVVVVPGKTDRQRTVTIYISKQNLG